MSMDERAFAKMKAVYGGMDDERLADIVANKWADLTEEARLALDEVTRQRDPEAFQRVLETAREESSQLISARIAEKEAPLLDRTHLDEQKGEIITEYKNAIVVVRWLAFLPMAMQASMINYRILQVMGYGALNSLKETNPDLLLAFAVAGVASAAFGILIGAWVCPLRQKVWPAIAVAVFLFGLQAYDFLHWVRYFTHAAARDAVQIDACSGMAACAAIGLAMIIRRWQLAGMSRAAQVSG